MKNQLNVEYNETKKVWQYTDDPDLSDWGLYIPVTDKNGNTANIYKVRKPPSHLKYTYTEGVGGSLDLTGDGYNWALLAMGYGEDSFFNFGEPLYHKLGLKVLCEYYVMNHRDFTIHYVERKQTVKKWSWWRGWYEEEVD